VETLSGEDDIVEVSMDENSCEKQEMKQEQSTDSIEKEQFLSMLGLITKNKCLELQNKRVERRRRSTANPQFVYSMLEQPSVSVFVIASLKCIHLSKYSEWIFIY